MTSPLKVMLHRFDIYVYLFLVYLIGCTETAPAQSAIRIRDHIYGNDTAKAFPANAPTIFHDTIKNECWYKKSLTVKWAKVNCWETGEQGLPGRDGVDGSSANIQVGTTTTGAPGTQAQVTNSGNPTNAIFNFVIPQGLKGEPGSGGGGSFSGITSPNQWGACGCNKTLAQSGYTTQSQVDAKFPGIGATPSRMTDWAGWQACINGSKGRIIIPESPEYFVDATIFYDLNPSAYILANGQKITTVNSTAYPVFGRKTKPTTRLQAEAMFGFRPMSIIGLEIQCQPAQTGFDLNCLRSPYVTQNIVTNATNGYKFDFCMRATVFQNDAIGCKNGFMSGLAIAGDNEMSSNLISMRQNECHTCSDTAYAIKHAYEVDFAQNVAEGNGTCKIALFIDYTNKTTANSERFGVFHFEQTGGATIAVVKVLLRHQKIEFEAIGAHYPGIILDAQMLSTNGAGGGVVVNRIVGSLGLNGKLFRSNGITWRFLFNDVMTPTSHTGKWDTTLGGVVPGFGARTQVGFNSYLFGSTDW